MPVSEFALDANASFRIQIHVNTRQGPVSVMLNQSVLGSLATLQEQSAGKDFRLPDNSILRVRILNGHPQAWRNGHPLLMTSGSGALPELPKERGSSLGSGTLVFLILSGLVMSALAISFFVNAISVLTIFVPYFGQTLLAFAGLGGILILLVRRKWGLYLLICSFLVSFVLAILSGLLDFRSFIALASVLVVIITLRSSSAWRKMQ